MRRLRGEGSVYQRKDGLWVGRYEAAGRRKYVYGKPKKAVTDRLRERLTSGLANLAPEADGVCERCGYEVEVSGGDDAGMIVNTTTILCEDCEELYDVITFRRARGPEEEPDPGPIEPRCPKSKRHTFRLWEHPGP